MELSSTYKLCTSIILAGSVIGCVKDNDESTSSHLPAEEISACQASVASIPAVPNDELPTRAISVNSPQDFGEDSAADFYLASGETFIFEERIYNFNNIYLENNSNIEISEQANKDTAVIKINALGSCDFYGNLNFEGYEGTVEIRCDGQFNFGAKLDSSDYSISVVGMRAIVIGKSEDNSGGEGGSGTGTIISNGDGLDGGGLIEIEGSEIIELDSIDFGGLDFTITENPTVIDGGAIIFDPCNSGA